MSDISAIRDKARSAYDNAPNPDTLKRIYGAMAKNIAMTEALRRSVDDEVASAPWMEQWDRDMRNLQMRMNDYQVTLDGFDAARYSDVAAHHGGDIGDVPTIYKNHVEIPILYGESGSRIVDYDYSQVGFPDVIQPILLSNQLNALDYWSFDVSGMTKRAMSDSIDWIDAETRDQSNAYIEERLEGLTAIANQKVEDALPGLIASAKSQIAGSAEEGAKRGILLPIIAATVAIVAFTRKR
jgi:hypothetical protein